RVCVVLVARRARAPRGHPLPPRRSSDLVALPISSWAGSSRHELRAAKLEREAAREASQAAQNDAVIEALEVYFELVRARAQERLDRKSTRLNSSHVKISYAGFRLKKKPP